jgi:iron complex transport system substrate-binding protein
MFPPQRIVCLTEETVETLYLLGEQDRIVGISGYCVRPPEARRNKPRVSAFTSADIPKIVDLRPDLVLSFSDLQADIVAALIRQGVAVHAFNQRTIAEILDMIRLLGALVGAAARADLLADKLDTGIKRARQRAMQLLWRPRVYFEEWDEPMIPGNRVGVGVDRGRGRHRHLRRSRIWKIGEGAHRYCSGDRRPPSRDHHRLVVRQEVPAREGSSST